VTFVFPNVREHSAGEHAGEGVLSDDRNNVLICKAKYDGGSVKRQAVT